MDPPTHPPSSAPPQSVLTTLQSQIDALTEFSARVPGLRQLPPLLLRTPGLDVGPDPAPGTLLETMKRVLLEATEMRRALLQTKVQEALRVAAESERRDHSGLRDGGRTGARKRRRSSTPESPRPYPSFHPRTASLFPSPEPSAPPLSIAGVSEYIRQFNAAPSREARLHIWLSGPKEPRDLRVPLLLRFVIPDILKAFIVLGHYEDPKEDRSQKYDDRPLLIETVTAFGARERKPPHSQSDYQVFLKLSQYIARMVQSAPRIPFQCFMDMLVTYEGLFETQCTVCQRVLSAEGSIPPVARVWRVQEGAEGVWDPRHVTCLQN